MLPRTFILINKLSEIMTFFTTAGEKSLSLTVSNLVDQVDSGRLKVDHTANNTLKYLNMI